MCVSELVEFSSSSSGSSTSHRPTPSRCFLKSQHRHLSSHLPNPIPPPANPFKRTFQGAMITAQFAASVDVCNNNANFDCNCVLLFFLLFFVPPTVTSLSTPTPSLFPLHPCLQHVSLCEGFCYFADSLSLSLYAGVVCGKPPAWEGEE